jgi:hypothetical protein
MGQATKKTYTEIVLSEENLINTTPEYLFFCQSM